MCQFIICLIGVLFWWLMIIPLLAYLYLFISRVRPFRFWAAWLLYCVGLSCLLHWIIS